MVLVLRDMTDRVRGEEELQKLQKLESLGNLAGGIAHDFNNCLAGILGNISLGKHALEPGSEAPMPVWRRRRRPARRPRSSPRSC